MGCESFGNQLVRRSSAAASINRASARETASRVAAGAVARKILGPGIVIRGALVQIGPHAIDRARNIAEGALFILPVCIDDTNGGDAQVPDKFKAVHFTRLPGGEVPPEFAQRIRELLSRK